MSSGVLEAFDSTFLMRAESGWVIGAAGNSDETMLLMHDDNVHDHAVSEERCTAITSGANSASASIAFFSRRLSVSAPLCISNCTADHCCEASAMSRADVSAWSGAVTSNCIPRFFAIRTSTSRTSTDFERTAHCTTLLPLHHRSISFSTYQSSEYNVSNISSKSPRKISTFSVQNKTFTESKLPTKISFHIVDLFTGVLQCHISISCD